MNDGQMGSEHLPTFGNCPNCLQCCDTQGRHLSLCLGPCHLAISVLSYMAEDVWVCKAIFVPGCIKLLLLITYSGPTICLYNTHVVGLFMIMGRLCHTQKD